MNLEELSNEELIKIFKENECLLATSDKACGKSKNTFRRLFIKRNIDWNAIKKKLLKDLENKYYLNPILCKNCGKVISYEQYKKDHNIQFCNTSCAASYNNKYRQPMSQETKTKISTKLKAIYKDDLLVFNSLKTYCCKQCGKSFTIRTERNTTGRQYCSSECREIWMRENIYSKAGGYREGSGHGNSGWYKGIHCDSSWELAFVIYYLDNNLFIKRCTEHRKYTFNNIEHTYIPDFITDEGIIEIKGYDSPQWEAKRLANPDIKVLYKLDIEFYLKYVHDKYGNDFINLYDDSNPKNDIASHKFIWLNNKIYDIFVTSDKYEKLIQDGWIRGKINKEIPKELIESLLKEGKTKTEISEKLYINRHRLSYLLKKYNL